MTPIRPAMERENIDCSGYRRGEGLCRHGFIQTGACTANPDPNFFRRTKPPMCMNEDWCAWFFASSGGKPKVTFP